MKADQRVISQEAWLLREPQASIRHSLKARSSFVRRDGMNRELYWELIDFAADKYAGVDFLF